ncbi:MAG: nuclear transport factor 2 family protein [Ilumatobacteraceae bacterium]
MGLTAPAPLPPVDVCRSYLASFTAGDPNLVVEHVTDDFVNEHTAALGSGCVGRSSYLARLPAFLASMPGLRYEVEDVIAVDSKVAVAYTLRAVVDGRPIAVRGMMRFDVRDGLIARRVDYWDSLVFQRQAGLA